MYVIIFKLFNMNCTINMAPCLEKLKPHKKQILKFLFFISGVAFFWSKVFKHLPHFSMLEKAFLYLEKL